jgi:hypothetical protein
MEIELRLSFIFFVSSRLRGKKPERETVTQPE